MNGACTVNGEQDVIGLHQSSRSTTWIHLKKEMKKRWKKDERKKKQEKGKKTEKKDLV